MAARRPARLRTPGPLRVLAALLVLAGPGVAGAEAPRVRVLIELEMQAFAEPLLARSAGEAAVFEQRTEIFLRQLAIATGMQGRDFRVTQAYASLPFLGAELPVDALPALVADPSVRVLTGDGPLRPQLAESTAIVEAPAAWGEGVEGLGQVVAVLDTGVDASHPHLAGKLAAEACFSGAGSCPDGSDAQVGAGAGAACPYSSECDHGTHVAGIAVGDSPGLSGVARGAGFVSVQVFSRFDGPPFCDEGESCPLSFTSDLIRGLEHVYGLRHHHRIAAVNLSLGGGFYPSVAECDLLNAGAKAAIDNLRGAGIATVVAAGNEGHRGALAAPACISSAISVGATDKAGRVESYSNTAPFLDLLAPGGGITSSVPGGGLRVLSGTSMAAPHAAGAFAILRQAVPEASVPALLADLKASGVGIALPLAAGSPPELRIRSALARVQVAPPEETHQLALKRLTGKSRLKGGKRRKIKWRASPGVVSSDVLYSLDGGASWTMIQDGVPLKVKKRKSKGKLKWRMPNPVSPRGPVLVRVDGYDAEGSLVASDQTTGGPTLVPR